MNAQTINMGNQSIYVENFSGKIVCGCSTETPKQAFKKISFQLEHYTPTLNPYIVRPEVAEILQWIENDIQDKKSVALIYGHAGIGKSIVMYDLYHSLCTKDNYLILGLKTDQIEFTDTDDLSKKMRLYRPLEDIVRDIAHSMKRVVLLIDQIDALSLSLSSNRTSLQSILQFIEQVRDINNIRIIISCRPYDQEYDPNLKSLDINAKWELKEFSKEQVKAILRQQRYCNNLSDDLLRFLGNPLYLHLFLLVYSQEQIPTPSSERDLYDALWKKYLCNPAINAITRNNLLKCLDEIVNTMYQRQELSIHRHNIETEFEQELNYLLSNRILIALNNNHVQFFHQTLFDYVYARRFVEKNRDIIDELRQQHQGLFVRAAVKSILAFQRDCAPATYIKSIDHILFDQDNNGKDVFRYHLKVLVLSNMVYFESPIQEEIDLIRRKIFKNELYIGIVLRAIRVKQWVDIIWNIVKIKDEWIALNSFYRESIIATCANLLHSDTDYVIDIFHQILDFGIGEDKNLISHKLTYTYALQGTPDKLISIYERLVTNRYPLEYVEVLRCIAKERPEYVCTEIKENVRLQLLQKEQKFYHKVDFNYAEEKNLDELEKLHPEITLNLYIELLTMMMEATHVVLPEYEISFSSKLANFELPKDGHVSYKSKEDVITHIINYSRQHITEDFTRQTIHKLAYSNFDGHVFIALYVYTQYPETFIQEAYKLLTKRSVLANAPSWVTFQAANLLAKTFPLMNREQKNTIINIISTISDIREIKRNKELTKNHLQHEEPITLMGHRKGVLLHLLPLNELQEHYNEAYKERISLERKFKHLELTPPLEISTYVGYPSMKKSCAEKMSPEDWCKSMEKYTTNDNHGWGTPSLTGQANLFENVVTQSPDKFIPWLEKILNNENIPLEYVNASIRGLLAANRIDEAGIVLEGIIDLIEDVNITYRSFPLYTLLITIEEFKKQAPISSKTIHFLCRVACEINEVSTEEYSGDDIYNKGINQPRGLACDLLVRCATKEYSEKVFTTLEDIAGTASIYTRAAILFNMALFNRIDKDRNVILYKKLLHDFHPKLLAMPIHNNNPLVYFVNYALDDIMDVFHQAMKYPECYEQQVILLWIAWIRNNHHIDSKRLLDQMCDNSENARIALLRFLYKLEDKIDEDAIEYIIYLMDPKFESKAMGDVCDHIFTHINECSLKTRERIAKEFVASPMCKYNIHSFLGFLSKYAKENPCATLLWLQKVIAFKNINEDYLENRVLDVLIPAYNMIQRFDYPEDRHILEISMDLIDQIMLQSPNASNILHLLDVLDNE